MSEEIESQESTIERAQTAPHPDHPAKVKEPTKLTADSWKLALKNTLRAVGADQVTDLAAALTYYTVLSVFPALLALVSLIILFGSADTLVPALTDLVNRAAPSDVADFFGQLLEQFLNSPGAGIALIVGILTALWTASNYMAAFARAMNKIYDVEEGRNAIKLKLQQFALTIAIILGVLIILASAVLGGSVAQAIGDAIGLGDTAVAVWSVARFGVILVVVIAMVALLYWATPNVKQPKFRWVSIGATVAIVLAALVSWAFTFYVGNFASYEATYGALGAIIIGLLWLWLINLSLLFGAELDTEVERVRQLQSGLDAERELQLPPRDDAGVQKKLEKSEAAEAEGRAIKEEAQAAKDDQPGRPRGEDGQPVPHPGADLANRMVRQGEGKSPEPEPTEEKSGD